MNVRKDERDLLETFFTRHGGAPFVCSSLSLAGDDGGEGMRGPLAKLDWPGEYLSPLHSWLVDGGVTW